MNEKRRQITRGIIIIIIVLACAFDVLFTTVYSSKFGVDPSLVLLCAIHLILSFLLCYALLEDNPKNVKFAFNVFKIFDGTAIPIRMCIIITEHRVFDAEWSVYPVSYIFYILTGACLFIAFMFYLFFFYKHREGYHKVIKISLLCSAIFSLVFSVLNVFTFIQFRPDWTELLQPFALFLYCTAIYIVTIYLDSCPEEQNE